MRRFFVNLYDQVVNNDLLSYNQNMEIKIITDEITLNELKEIANNQFGDMVKAVVDIQKEIMAIAGELHADEESVLLNNGSSQEDLWGINLHVEKADKDFVEFDSMINIRPSQNNRSRGVEDTNIQEKIIQIVNKIVKK